MENISIKNKITDSQPHICAHTYTHTCMYISLWNIKVFCQLLTSLGLGDFAICLLFAFQGGFSNYALHTYMHTHTHTRASLLLPFPFRCCAVVFLLWLWTYICSKLWSANNVSMVFSCTQFASLVQGHIKNWKSSQQHVF